MRALQQNALILDMNTIENHMTECPQSISLDTPVEEAMESMTEQRFRHSESCKMIGCVAFCPLVTW